MRKFPSSTRIVSRTLAIALLPIALAACMVGPDHVRPTLAVPGQFVRNDANPVAVAPQPDPNADFWNAFDDPMLTRLVDEALVAGNIANTNGLLVILAKLVAKGIFDADDLQAFSDSYSKPLDHEHMRDNELVSQMQDQMEETLAQLMHFLAERP